MPPEHGSRDRGGEEKKCLGYRLPGIVGAGLGEKLGAEMGEKGIFVGRIAVVFIFHVQEGELGSFFCFTPFFSLLLMGGWCELGFGWQLWRELCVFLCVLDSNRLFALFFFIVLYLNSLFFRLLTYTVVCSHLVSSSKCLSISSVIMSASI